MGDEPLNRLPKKFQAPGQPENPFEAAFESAMDADDQIGFEDLAQMSFQDMTPEKVLPLLKKLFGNGQFSFGDDNDIIPGQPLGIIQISVQHPGEVPPNADELAEQLTNALQRALHQLKPEELLKLLLSSPGVKGVENLPPAISSLLENLRAAANFGENSPNDEKSKKVRPFQPKNFTFGRYHDFDSMN